MKREPKEYSNPASWAINGQPPPPEVWERILHYHISPTVSIWYETGIALLPSLGSCYRPKAWELLKGRSGVSLHTFPGTSRGAVDLVRSDGVDISSVMDILIDAAPWRRLCFYPRQRFVHADYGDHDGEPCQRRELYQASGPGDAWRFLQYLPEPRR